MMWNSHTPFWQSKFRALGNGSISVKYWKSVVKIFKTSCFRFKTISKDADKNWYEYERKLNNGYSVYNLIFLDAVW